MLPEVVDKMPWTDDFTVDHHGRTVSLKDRSDGKDTSAACTNAFTALVQRCIDQDTFSSIHGDHSEPFAILGAKYPVQIERFASSLFGITSRGAHLTAHTRGSEGMKIWVPRRNPNLKTYPNMLDTTVAGGVPADESPFDNMVREADEEASLPAELVRQNVRSVGCLTYIGLTGTGYGVEEAGLVVPDIVYLFDLELDEDVVPKPKDDEVKEFTLMSVEEVKKAMLGGEFKPNCAVVMIDFFIRHGIITAAEEKDFVEITTRMHRKLPFRTAPNLG